VAAVEKEETRPATSRSRRWVAHGPGFKAVADTGLPKVRCGKRTATQEQAFTQRRMRQRAAWRENRPRVVRPQP
jgi:hypothetical protein